MKKNRRLILIAVLVVLAAAVVLGPKLSRSPAAPSFTAAPLVTLPPAEATPTPEPAAPTDAPAQPTPAPDPEPTPEPKPEPEPAVTEDGKYDTRDEVALYIRAFGHLPSNYVTKREAKKAGWSGGRLEDYCPGCSIGGDVFMNREGLLPEAEGRVYHECDIEATGKKTRGAKRIVFSNDGLIYYTDDHYDSFALLCGEEDGA